MESKTGRRHGARHALVFAALCAALIGAVAVSSAGAKQAKVLGRTKHTPPPSCPGNPCSAIGGVTGFQRVANGQRNPYNVYKSGKLVAWAIDLSRPKKSQRTFFGRTFRNGRFGRDPYARLAVIRHRGHRKYKLLRQSPAVNLSGSLGHKEIFTLDKPLRVRKGQIVALTVPTWASNFATGISSRDNQWRASRGRGHCDTSKIHNAKRSRAQQKVGSVRGYGCDYKGARLLYWAYYVRG